jgi:hypothetical protein
MVLPSVVPVLWYYSRLYPVQYTHCYAPVSAYERVEVTLCCTYVHTQGVGLQAKRIQLDTPVWRGTHVCPHEGVQWYVGMHHGGIDRTHCIDIVNCIRIDRCVYVYGYPHRASIVDQRLRSIAPMW